MEGFEKRRALRVPAKFVVSYLGLDAPHADWTIDVSKSGVFIATDNPMPLGSKPSFFLHPTEAHGRSPRRFLMSGRVVRHSGRAALKTGGMGLCLDSTQGDYKAFFDEHIVPLTTATAGQEQRGSARLDAQLTVRFRSLQDFALEYTRNISKGGLYFESQKNYSVGSTLQLTLVLPGVNLELETQAKIVYAKYHEVKERYGVGLQFVSAEAEFDRKLDSFFTWAKNHSLAVN